MYNDEPTLLDRLDRGSLIQEVGDAIASCTPPQVFGVHGDWGLGKTSFLHQVQLYLTDDCPQQSDEARKAAKREATDRAVELGKYKGTIRAVWFDAWRYQNEDAPVVALLQEMRTQLSLFGKVRRSVSRRSEVLTRGALLSIEELTKRIGFQYSKFRQAENEWKATNLASELPSYRIREHLREAIGQLLPGKPGSNKHRRLAVFIDDVDRCEPEIAYRLLEGLKIYLTLDNCVFILGMNQKVVESAIGYRMAAFGPGLTPSDIERAVESAMSRGTEVPRSSARTDDTVGELGRTRAAAYMEKLCQNVWRLPAIRDPGQVLHDLLKTTVTDEAVREWIRQAVKAPPCLPPNPRRLKGLANLIGRLSSRLPKPKDVPREELGVREAQLLVIVAYIYQFHHDIYIRWEADTNLYKQVYDRCRGSDLELPFLTSLVLPKRGIDTDPTMPLQELGLESTYPDPTATNVFWIQPLILYLGSEVNPREFERYLNSEST